MSDHLNIPSTRVEYVVIPPDRGWGWFVVFIAFCWNMVTDGTTYTFALFLDEMLEDFDVSPSILMLASSLQCGLYYLFGPVSASIINRFGFRMVSISGACLAFGGLLASAYVKNVYVFITTFGCVMGLAFSMSYLSNILVVGFYFSKYRPIATSIAVTGSAVGVSIAPFIFSVILEHIEWREKYKYLSGAHLLMAFLAFVYKPIVPTQIIVPEPRAAQAESSGGSERSKGGRYLWDFPTNAEALQNQEYIIVIHESDSKTSELMTSTYNSTRTSRSTKPLSEMTHPIVNSELIREYTKCCCCYCQRRHMICPMLWNTRRPMYRDDILYQGSTKRLPHYNKSETDLLKAQTTYNMKVTRTSNMSDVPQSADCCNCCPDSVLRVINSMLDLTLFKSYAFSLLCLSSFLTFLGFYVPYVYGIKHSIICNIEHNKATYILTAIGISNGVGRLSFGFVPLMCPKITAMLISQVTLIVAGIAVIVHPFFVQFHFHLACVSVFGLCIATISSLRTIIVVELLGLEKLTNAFGLIVLSEGISSIVALPLNAYLNDVYNDLKLPFVFSGAVIILSGVLLIPVNSVNRWENNRRAMKESPERPPRSATLF